MRGHGVEIRGLRRALAPGELLRQRVGRGDEPPVLFRAEAGRRRVRDGKKRLDLLLRIAEAQRPECLELRQIVQIRLAQAHAQFSFQSATYFSSSTVGWYDSFARRRPSEPMSSSRLRNCTSGYFSAIMRENSRLIMA